MTTLFKQDLSPLSCGQSVPAFGFYASTWDENENTIRSISFEVKAKRNQIINWTGEDGRAQAVFSWTCPLWYVRVLAEVKLRLYPHQKERADVMRKVIDPGRVRPTLTMMDDICYSHVTDLEGKPLDLTLSLLTIRRPPRRPGQPEPPKAPAIIWVNGNGWRTPYASRNMMVPELTFLAYQGFVVASVYYRTSDQGRFPSQVIDIKTAVRFLRANADKYGIDPERIGVYGRSAGGHVTSFLAMNTDDFISEEWSGYSSEIQAACDMFGPVDMTVTVQANVERLQDPNARWHSMEETYDAKLLGWEGSVEKLLERATAASPINYINDKMCPILIMHGDADNSVPMSISEDFYKRIVDKGMEDRADLYILEKAGHGSPEFYQDSTRQILLEFFEKYLKG